MRVLVTGGTGLVGSHVLKALVRENKHEIIAIRRKTSAMHLVEQFEDQIEWHDCDIVDLIKLKDVTKDINIVIHAAAYISLNSKDKQQLYNINAEGTANVVNCCIVNQVEQLIYVSSTAVLGGARGRLIHEDDHWVDKPLKLTYAHSKYLGEQEVWRGAAEGLSVNIVAPSLVVGAGFWHSAPALISQMDKGIKSYPTGSYGVVDARDVASMILSLIEISKPNQKYICSAENLTLKELCNLIAQSLNKPPVSRPLEGIYFRLILLLSTINYWFPFNKDLSKDHLIISNQEIRFDNQKSINDLNFTFRKVSQTVQDTVMAYKQSMERNSPYAYPLD